MIPLSVCSWRYWLIVWNPLVYVSSQQVGFQIKYYRSRLKLFMAHVRHSQWLPMKIKDIPISANHPDTYRRRLLHPLRWPFDADWWLTTEANDIHGVCSTYILLPILWFQGKIWNNEVARTIPYRNNKLGSTSPVSSSTMRLGTFGQYCITSQSRGCLILLAKNKN